MKNYFFLFALLSSFAYADVECPKDSNETLQMIQDSGICYDAGEIARYCADSAATEIEYAQAASDVCRQAFATQMNAKEKAAYKTLLSKCEDNATHASGAYQLAMIAMCTLDVDVLMSSLFTIAQ